ncbi:MAG: thymidine kinase [Holophagales bacterium]|nr:thymidine kinase [Holophagales bacterium]
MNERASRGHIEVIAGAMFSGKSEELIRRLRRAEIARQRIQVFKPAADTRSEGVVSRDNRSLDATAVASSHEMRRRLHWSVQVVGIDEAQFFDLELWRLVVEMADAGMRVIVAGLDMDYRGEPFGPVPNLMAVADYVTKVHAICVQCGEPAQFSQRIAGGQEQVLVGDTESYEARCRRCFRHPDTAQRSLKLEIAELESPADAVLEPVARTGGREGR